MSVTSLEDKIQQSGGPVEMLRNAQSGGYVFPMRPEFSNWRDEQKATTTTAVLFDQSFHMTDLYIEGPDTTRFLSDFSVNSFKTWGRDKAKQLINCNDEGFIIGDAVVFALEDDKALVIGRPPSANWLQFNAEKGGYNISVERDERSLQNSRPRKLYRYEVQGPMAMQVLEKLNGGPLPPIKFFNMGEITIKGRKVRALRHGMSGAPGLEIWGPWEEAAEITDAIVEAGRDFGLRQAGGRTYSTASTESAWLASTMPAIYAGDAYKSYRQWLKPESFEANASLGGSFYSDNVQDYYLTPWELGYNFVKFDHDFVGREALERSEGQVHRKKITCIWNNEDVIRIFGSLFADEGQRYKYMEVPASYYASMPFDKIMKDGKMVGVSTYPVYTVNAQSWISLCVVDDAVSAPGTEVSIVWGEEDGGSRKPAVERHVQTEVRATVAPAPYSRQARDSYRPHAMAVSA